MLQAVLYHLKLQLPHGADYLAPVHLADKELRHTLVHQLVHALVELFLLHGVGVLYVLEHLRREGGKSLEMQFLACRQGVAYLEVAGIGQTDDVACECLIHRLFALRHEAGRRGETHLLVLAHMLVVGVALELPAANLEERNARTMVGVHVRVYLKAEARELIFHRLHFPLHSLYGERRGGNAHEAL